MGLIVYSFTTLLRQNATEYWLQRSRRRCWVIWEGKSEPRARLSDYVGPFCLMAARL